MLKPIHRVSCSPALAACQQLMRTFALWLCDPMTTASSITQAHMQPPTFPTTIEANWLWNFLNRIASEKALLTHAKTLAEMPAREKGLLKRWSQTVSNLVVQFQTGSTPWPAKPPLTKVNWTAFKTLMEMFYEKGFRSGLPYSADGTPVDSGGLDYAAFVKVFRDTHRLSPDPHAREVCVLCGGPLVQVEVDHWIAKNAFPLLSVCENNLLPICGECNSTENKGQGSVHCDGDFSNWFHPHFRPATGAFSLNYSLPNLAVGCIANQSIDQPKVNNLDNLLNLSKRWTREFKAEYSKQQRSLVQSEQERIQTGRCRRTRDEIKSSLQDLQNSLLSSEPNYEVHNLLFDAMLEQARLDSWHTELGLV